MPSAQAVPPDADGGVVVPAVDAASSVAAIRSLGRQGVATIAAAEEPAAPGFASRYRDEAVAVPDPAHDVGAYGEALLELARRDDVATVMPFREVDVYALARDRERFAEHVGTPWPTLSTLRGAQDRARLFAAAEDAGVATPETASLDEWDDWDREVIVKPRFTVLAPEYADVAEARPQTGSTRYLEPGSEPDREELVADYRHVPLVQEYVPTRDEYGFFALYDRGEAVATFQHRQRRGFKYCGGPSAYRESTDIPELEAAGRRLLDALDWHGLAMVEFLRDPETGEFRLMEVNPRFWSSLPFTVQAGAHFPTYYYAQATGRPVWSPDHDVGVAGHLLRGELLYLHSLVAEDYPLVERPSLPREAAKVAASLLRHPRFDYLSADDPMPFVRDVRNVAGEALRPSRPQIGRAARGTAAAIRSLLVRR